MTGPRGPTAATGDPLARLVVTNPDVLLANLRAHIRHEVEGWQVSAERDKADRSVQGEYARIILMLLAEREVLLACERENEELVLDRDCRRLERGRS